MSLKVLLQPGDCFSISLADGTFAFGQYLGLDRDVGHLIRVFDVIAGGDAVNLSVLRNAGLRFPPIAVGLNPPVRMKRWRKIGHFSVDHLPPPKFRRSVQHRKGTNHDWQIWDGETWKRVGDLPPEYRCLEVSGVWAYGDVEERILTGRDPFHEGVQ
jgi:hypothetical protein